MQLLNGRWIRTMIFDHIGYAVNNIREAQKAFASVGQYFGEPVADEFRHVEICFNNGPDRAIELIAPLDEKSPVSDILRKRGNSPYHICFVTDNIEKEIERLCKEGFMPLEKPAPAVAFGGKRVCFLFHRAMGLMELVEEYRKPLVTICCITYNHGPYIRKTLEGFLEQQADFPVRILIHDDASEDDTISILREYEQRYSFIDVMYEERNQFSRGVNIAFDIMLPRVESKYVAICEGDDYWTDPHKLSRQIGFMETNDACVMTVHNGVKKDCDTQEETVINPFKITKYLDDEEMFMAFMNNPPTASFVLKRDVITGYPDFVREAPVVDDVLRLYYHSKGRVFYFDDVMCCRQVNHDFSWNRLIQEDAGLYEDYVRRILVFYEQYDKYTSLKYHDLICRVVHKIKRRYYHLSGKELSSRGDA